METKSLLPPSPTLTVERTDDYLPEQNIRNVKLSWVIPETGICQPCTFRIERSPLRHFADTAENIIIRNRLSHEQRSYTDRVSSGKHYYRIRAENEDGAGEWSNEAYVEIPRPKEDPDKAKEDVCFRIVEFHKDKSFSTDVCSSDMVNALITAQKMIECKTLTKISVFRLKRIDLQVGENKVTTYTQVPVFDVIRR